MLQGKFKLVSPFKPKGDQEQAIEKLFKGLVNSKKYQTLLGITGSGKTFNLANIIEKFNRPVLVISHNKTLAAQLFQELRDFFPDNSVNYFVSYYDYYQPEAYIPTTDTYIEKDAKINDELDKLRHAATSNISERSDVIIVASCSCIYGIGEPEDYRNMAIEIVKSGYLTQKEFISILINLQYERNNFILERGTFRRRENMIEMGIIDENAILRIFFDKNKVAKIIKMSHNPDNKNSSASYSEFLVTPDKKTEDLNFIKIYPAKHFTTPKDKLTLSIQNIKLELNERADFFKKHNKLLERERLLARTKEDMHFMNETGYCKGIENYERHLYFRNSGDPPSTLIDYFPKGFLTIIDESHMTLPQLRGMYEGDKSRKTTLVNYGFRLPSALDHRPLKFQEILKKLDNSSQTIFLSATPADFEIEKSIEKIEVYYKRLKEIAELKESNALSDFYLNLDGVAEQLIRPTGLLDPKIELKMNIENPMKDLIEEVRKEIASNGRALVLTITKRLAEAISEVLEVNGFKTNYLHSEIKTLERPEVLKDLRLGKYEVIVGINLLREGLDIPEVSLIAILEGDKEGFLRNKKSLIQMIGRAARHPNGRAIIYASHLTISIEETIFETKRRRIVQEKYNQINNITPAHIIKEIKNPILPYKKDEKVSFKENIDEEFSSLKNKKIIIQELEKEMKKAAKNLDFERAAYLRDKVEKLKT